MRYSRKSILLVIVQFVALAYLAVPRGAPAFVPLALLAAVPGALLGIWAVWSVRRSRLSVLPDPAPGARLVTAGPYRLIRHPMYAAVLLVALALLALRPSPDRVAAWMILAADLILKMRHEERLLAARFPGYAAYRRRTWRLMPRAY